MSTFIIDHSAIKTKLVFIVTQSSFYRNLTWIKVDEQQSKEIFFPKLRIWNDKEVASGIEYGPNHGSDFLWVRHDGKMMYQERLKITVYCPFDFGNFPFDSHQCDLNIGVSNYFPDQVKLSALTILYKNLSTTLGEEGILIDSILSPEPFDVNLTSIEPFDVSENNYSFSFTGMHMEFYRSDIGCLVGSYYFPTFTFSILSLMSYAIHPDSVAGRNGLLVTLDLIFVNIYNSVKGPSTRGYSFIEVWMVGMQIPIFLGIIEYAVLLMFKRFELMDGCFNRLSKKIDIWTFVISSLYIVIFVTAYWVRQGYVTLSVV